MILWLCALGIFHFPPVHAQQDPVDEQVARLMDRMTTEEKVGQLFVVAFWGRNPSSGSWAGKLIQEYKIGGVVLITSNSNLSNAEPDTPRQVARLNNTLQQMAFDEEGSSIPLFVAIDHEGDGFPYTRITNGLTPLPSPMAIGATWDTAYAEQVGEIIGRELSALGINMLLGPVLDVLDDPNPGSKGDVGSRVFGGDPFWVGEMGRATIRGVHTGSQGRMLTVAKHFPGHGGSDRLPDDEVATVDKSLQELQRVDLGPFFAVTGETHFSNDGSAPCEDCLADALMSSHIRYRGFWGDIRRYTRPITFDSEAMQALLNLDELRAWRQDGLIVSDSLGVPAVRKYFDPTLQTFPHRQIAREAFLTGNDLLLLSQFSLSFDLLQHYQNVAQVLAYFAEAYDQEPSFAARVDESLRRILAHKLKLYPDLTLKQVLVDPETLSLGQGLPVVQEIARQAVTVLQPTEDSLPPPPRRGDDILIFGEQRLVRECYDDFPECELGPLLPVTATEQAILRLYGPQGTGLVDPESIHTRTFAELRTFLTQPRTTRASIPSAGNPITETLPSLDVLLSQAEWIVFTMFEPTPWYPDSDALQLFLAENAQHLYGAKVIVFAYTVPYSLDVTEISKLDAYYVLYGKTLPCVEAAVRTLFGEVRPRGRSPVSIEGISYDLGEQLAPDPQQMISLLRIEPSVTSALIPVTLHLQAGPILDHNGHPVPDGTLVRFTAQPVDASITGSVVSVEGTTVDGVARAELILTRPGRMQVTASSGNATDSIALVFEALALPTPTPTPTIQNTATPRPTATAQNTPTPTIPPTLTPNPVPIQPTLSPTPSPGILSSLRRAWIGRPIDLLAVLAALLSAIGFRLWISRLSMPAHRLRLALLAWVGGLAGFLIYGLSGFPVLPWPSWLLSALWTLFGGMVGGLAGMLKPPK